MSVGVAVDGLMQLAGSSGGGLGGGGGGDGEAQVGTALLKALHLQHPAQVSQLHLLCHVTVSLVRQ